MQELTKKDCTVCKIGAPLATADEINHYMRQLTDWHIIEEKGINRLNRTYAFNDFAAALSFTDRVGLLAEQNGHHPSILTEWGKVTVTWWSHKIKGLHENDFIMAAKTDLLFKSDDKKNACR